MLFRIPKVISAFYVQRIKNLKDTVGSDCHEFDNQTNPG